MAFSIKKPKEKKDTRPYPSPITNLFGVGREREVKQSKELKKKINAIKKGDTVIITEANGFGEKYHSERHFGLVEGVNNSENSIIIEDESDEGYRNPIGKVSIISIKKVKKGYDFSTLASERNR